MLSYFFYLSSKIVKLIRLIEMKIGEIVIDLFSVIKLFVFTVVLTKK